MNLLPLPAFTDNYIWMLHDGRQAVVVDPGDASPVVQALQHLGLQLKAILVTHHHADHVGGVDSLRNATGAMVYGPASERIPQPAVALGAHDVVETLGLRFEVIDVPGHTAGHIAYYCPDMEEFNDFANLNNITLYQGKEGYETNTTEVIIDGRHYLVVGLFSGATIDIIRSW